MSILENQRRVHAYISLAVTLANNDGGRHESKRYQPIISLWRRCVRVACSRERRSQSRGGARV